jgi:hypothetical protein
MLKRSSFNQCKMQSVNLAMSKLKGSMVILRPIKVLELSGINKAESYYEHMFT